MPSGPHKEQFYLEGKGFAEAVNGRDPAVPLQQALGLHGEDRDKYQGRQQGPQLTWKCAAGQMSTVAGGMFNPISRAWRLSHGWLATSVKARSQRAKARAAWNIRHYDQNLQVDDPSLQEDRRRFQHWQSGIADAMLQHRATAEVFRDIASASADRVEEETPKRTRQ